MESVTKKIESPAWQNPAPGNEQNDSVKVPTNDTIKNGGNSRSAEDDLDLEKQPYRDDTFKKAPASKAKNSVSKDPVEEHDPNEERGERSIKK